MLSVECFALEINRSRGHVALVQDCYRQLMKRYGGNRSYRLCLQDCPYGYGDEETLAEGGLLDVLLTLAYRLGLEAGEEWTCRYSLSGSDSLKVCFSSDSDDQRYYAIRVA